MPKWPPLAIRVSLAVLALLALVGWGLLVAANVDHARSTAHWAEERGEFSGRIADLEGMLELQRTAAGDLAELERGIADAKAALNERMTILGEREQDLARAETALTTATERLATLQGDSAATGSRLSQRLTVLGERERDLATAERALRRVQARLDEVIGHTDQIEQSLTTKQATATTLQREVNGLTRERDTNADELEQIVAELTAKRAELADATVGLDRALLARSLVELQQREAELKNEVAGLDAQLEQKRPLVDRSFRISQRLVALNGQFETLIGERDRLAAELEQLVQDLE